MRNEKIYAFTSSDMYSDNNRHINMYFSLPFFYILVDQRILGCVSQLFHVYSCNQLFKSHHPSARISFPPLIFFQAFNDTSQLRHPMQYAEPKMRVSRQENLSKCCSSQLLATEITATAQDTQNNIHISE